MVDISEKCIAACRERFRERSHIDYHINDGKSLGFVENASIDFVFSFELVGARRGGCHRSLYERAGADSQAGARGSSIIPILASSGHFSRPIRELPGIGGCIPSSRRWVCWGLRHWQAQHAATKFSDYARQAGLACTSQEKINWGGRRTIDCLSSFTKGGPSRTSEPTIIRNPHFMNEAGYLSKLSRIYGSPARAS